MKALRWLGGWKPWAIIALLSGTYAAVGFWAVPQLLRSQLVEQVAARYGRDLQVGAIRFNPFSLRLEIDELLLPDADAAPMLGFRHLAVDVQSSSLWRRGLVFSEITLAEPFVRLETRADGRFNLLDLVPAAHTGPPPEPPPAARPPPRLFVDRLQVDGGEIRLADLTPPEPFRATLKPIHLALRDFSTRAGGDNAGEFTGQSLAGERFAWRGRVDVAPFRSTGTVEISALQAATLLGLLDAPLPFDVARGAIGLTASYALTAGTPLRLDVTVPQVTLTDVALQARDLGQELVTLPSVVVSDTRVSLQDRRVHVARVALTGATVEAWLDAAGINLQRLAGRRGAVAAAPAAAVESGAPAAPAAASGAARWTAAVDAIELREAAVNFEDRTIEPAVRLALTPVSLAINGWTSAPGGTLDVKADVGVASGGRLQAQGTLPLADLAADLAVQLQGLDLPQFQPYVARYTGLILRHGTLDIDGRLQAGPLGGRQLAFAGDAGVTGLRVVDRRLGQDLVKWDRLDVRKLSYAQSPGSLGIDSIVARRPYARVLIAPDGTLNITRAFSPAGQREEGAAAAAPAGAPAAARAKDASGKAATAGAAPALAMKIGRVQFVDGSANFADLSLTPNFQAGIQALNGTVVGLSSDPRQRARVDLKGQVDRYSPVVIAGEVNYLSTAAYTDIAMSFRNMELTTFNPYSTKWMGYRIAKGKLTTELAYKVVDRKLDAKHHVVIDQLEFGERSNSPDAITLPLKLAVALLKDRHGVIDLDLPVSGSLDDPQFRLGPVIWKIVRNLLVKIVTAPFALLGSLFGGGPDINVIDFAPGVADLDEAARGKLATVSKGLAERPQLKLEVPLAMAAELDRPALETRRFEAQLTELAEAGGRAEAAERQPVVDPAERLKVLEQWYRREFGQKPAVPLPPDVEPKLAKEQAAEPAYRIAWLEGQLRPRVTVTDADLQALAKARSDAVLALLLADSGVDPARVFVTAARSAAAAGTAVRMELKLE